MALPEDEMTPEAYDTLRKIMRKVFKDNVPMFSRKEMISFGNYVAKHNNHTKMSEYLEDWLKDSSVKGT